MSEEKVFKAYKIDFKNKADRRKLMDILCAKFNEAKKTVASEIDLIDFCVDHNIEFSGFKSDTAPVYHLKVRFELIEETPSEELMIKNPDTIPPNKSIGETESDLLAVKDFVPSEDEKREQRASNAENKPNGDPEDWDFDEE